EVDRDVVSGPHRDLRRRRAAVFVVRAGVLVELEGHVCVAGAAGPLEGGVEENVPADGIGGRGGRQRLSLWCCGTPRRERPTAGIVLAAVEDRVAAVIRNGYEVD